jgi:integrase/recombinase XerD
MIKEVSAMKNQNGRSNSSYSLDVMLEAYMLERYSLRVAKATHDRCRNFLGGFVSFLKSRSASDVTEIRATHIREYLVSLRRRGLAESSVYGQALTVRAWLNWLVEMNQLEVSPMIRMQLPRVRTPRYEEQRQSAFLEEELKKLMASCDQKTAIGSRHYAIILCLLDTGLRVHELLSLNIGDIDFETGIAHPSGQSGRWLTVAFGTKTRQAILGMLDFRPEALPNDALFVGYQGHSCEPTGRLRAEGVQSLLHRLGKSAGVLPCSASRFRMTFLIHCIRSGMDLESLRLLMGYRSCDVFKRFLPLMDCDLVTAHREHGPADHMSL